MSILRIPARTAMSLAGCATELFPRVGFIVPNLETDNRAEMHSFVGRADGQRSLKSIVRTRHSPSKFT
jgi:hypothetical protein